MVILCIVGVCKVAVVVVVVVGGHCAPVCIHTGRCEELIEMPGLSSVAGIRVTVVTKSEEDGS
jgi:hypothetical protein